MTVTDAQLIRSSLARPEAFEEIFERHFGAISKYMRRRLPQDVADELVGDVFAAAFAGRRRYRLEQEHALPWLYGIATNIVRRQRREEKSAFTAYARVEVPVEAAADDPADGEADLAAALRDLDPADLDVLLLFAWAELSYAEIADALEVPVGTVKSRLNRARRQVRASLAIDAPAKQMGGRTDG